MNTLLALIPLAIALSLRPWRLLAGRPALATPLLATLVVLPWLWALPALQHASVQLQWSGAVLVLLMLGWPLAVPALLAVGALAWAISPMPPEAALAAAVWQGVVPATLALAVGAAVRRWLPPHPFVYILGRGFLGALVSLFAARMLAQALGTPAAGGAAGMGLVVAQWLMAWGDAFVTGMLTAIFVAFRPQWLLTWSDARYLPRPGDSRR
ncbi:MAG TPA: hypothetical protein VFM98_09170 [Ramlibacter sp.]|uniref:hypothetical protein n=1 Tax=Ramlibacter sp. TaxID=1917967 RepID=UPI002D80F536|nr:hypothetical protein [Ramlibacter sp.]HET8745765.1 hypothetical protein [Ramlibacter sp.]